MARDQEPPTVAVPPGVPESPDRIAVRYGLRWGAFNAVCGAAFATVTVVNNATHGTVDGLWFAGCIPFLLWSLLLALAGAYAMRRAGTLGAAALAGTVCGLLGGVAFAAVAILGFMLQRSHPYSAATLVLSGVVVAVVLAGIGAGLGAGLALVGAFFAMPQRARASGPTVDPAPPTC
jgi:hypothetical protein